MSHSACWTRNAAPTVQQGTDAYSNATHSHNEGKQPRSWLENPFSHLPNGGNLSITFESTKQLIEQLQEIIDKYSFVRRSTFQQFFPDCVNGSLGRGDAPSEDIVSELDNTPEPSQQIFHLPFPVTSLSPRAFPWPATSEEDGYYDNIVNRGPSAAASGRTPNGVHSTKISNRGPSAAVSGSIGNSLSWCERAKLYLKVSDNYKGDLWIKRNHSAPITEEENCSFYLRGLPADVKITDILAAIRNTGKVWQCHVNPPTGPHRHSAAKLTFFTRESAQKFYADNKNGFSVGSHLADVLWNRIRVPEQIGGTAQKSRVVRIRGPWTFVNSDNIRRILDEGMKFYDVEKARQSVFGLEMVLELHFGSFRAQAEAAEILVQREALLKRINGVSIQFGIDPCA